MCSRRLLRTDRRRAPGHRDMAGEQDKATKKNLETPHPNPKKKVEPTFDRTATATVRKRKRHRLYL